MPYIFVYSLLSELEEKIRRLNKDKADKAAQVSELLEQVDSLRKEIDKKAEGYASCTA